MFSLNEELSEDPLIQDEVSDVTSLKMKSIKNKWRNLSEMIQAKSERCVELRLVLFKSFSMLFLTFNSNLSKLPL